MSGSNGISSVVYFADKSVSIYRDLHEKTLNHFLPGSYSARIINDELSIKQDEFKEIHTPFADQGLDSVMKYVDAFTQAENRAKINSLGYVYKCNLLFHGLQGTGKSSCSSFIMDSLIKTNDAIVFNISSLSQLEVTWSICEEIRAIQDNLIIIYMDEFDQFLSDGRNEGYLKNILDGSKSIDNSMVIACTNYLDKIPTTIVERPSRFCIVHEIKGIDKPEVRRSIIDNVIKGDSSILTEEQINRICTNDTANTVDKIKNAIESTIMDVSIGYKGRTKIGFSNEESFDENTPLNTHPFKDFMSSLSFIDVKEYDD